MATSTHYDGHERNPYIYISFADKVMDPFKAENGAFDPHIGPQDGQQPLIARNGGAANHTLNYLFDRDHKANEEQQQRNLNRFFQQVVAMGTIGAALWQPKTSFIEWNGPQDAALAERLKKNGSLLNEDGSFAATLDLQRAMEDQISGIGISTVPALTLGYDGPAASDSFMSVSMEDGTMEEAVYAFPDLEPAPDFQAEALGQPNASFESPILKGPSFQSMTM